MPSTKETLTTRTHVSRVPSARDPRSDGVFTAHGLLQTALCALEEGVLVLDRQGRPIHANEAASRILGFDPTEDAIQESWWKPLAPAGNIPDSPLEVGETVLKSGQAIRDVDVEVDRDGEKIALSVNYLPLQGRSGNVDGLVLSFRDVSAQERERRSLVEVQERLREASSVARLASWEWQPDTGEVLVLQALDEQQMPAGTPVSFDEWLAMVPAEQRKQVEEDFAALVRGERDHFSRLVSNTSVDAPIWWDIRASAVRDGAGQLCCVRGTAQDVTDQVTAKQELAEHLDFFEAVLGSFSAHVAVLDASGEIIMTNRAWDEFAACNGGVAERCGVGSNYLVACAVAGDDAAIAAAEGVRAIASGAKVEFSLEYPCHSPFEERWFQMRAARFDGSGPVRIVVSHETITERHEAQQQTAMQAALLDEIDAAVIVNDLDGTITSWSAGAEQLYGWTRDEALGRSILELVAPLDDNSIERVLTTVISQGRWAGEFQARRKDGSTFHGYARSRAICDEAGRASSLVGVSSDISERVAAERALTEARDYARAVAEGMAEGVITLDNEGCIAFVNNAAEELIGWTSEELHDRPMQELLHPRGSHSPDQPSGESPILRARQQRIAVRVEDDLFRCRDGRTLPVAYTAAPFETAAGVQGCAVVFQDISERKANEEALQRDAMTLSWIDRVKDALAGDRMMLYAQPIIDLKTRQKVQQELLLRMREEDGEIVAPGAFLPIAEQYGLIADIDRLVIRRAAELAAAGSPVEINISARSLSDPDMLHWIELCIAQNHADPKLLVFEITETAIAENEQAARALAERLHELGCRLALDDFGTGFGGFTYLKQLPVDFLKIDIEFVRDMASNTASLRLVQAVVALARDFGIRTVAEGVENADTLELLIEMGVDFAQGYHIGRPAPLAEGAPLGS